MKASSMETRGELTLSQPQAHFLNKGEKDIVLERSKSRTILHKAHGPLVPTNPHVRAALGQSIAFR